MAISFEGDMTSDVAEFLRILPDAAAAAFDAIGAAAPAVESRAEGADGRRVTLTSAARRVAIELAPRPARRIGALVLPVTRVRIALSGFTGNEAEKFMTRFDVHYRKGGG